MGPEVAECEKALAALTGSAHCITVASGTEALLIALMAKGIGSGDEVITTPFTFAATVETIVLAGAKPVFVDIESDTCNIDVTKIDAAITSRTRAIMPVSLYGQPSDMDEINSIAASHGLSVIEDAAQSLGATYNGHASANLSEIGCTSFFPSKPLGCYGDGGAIFTNNDEVAQACREIRVHGQSGRYEHTRVGVGGRMDTMQCAIILAKLERFEWEIAQRQRLAFRYLTAIREMGLDLLPVSVREGRTSAWAQFTVRTANRDKLIEELGNRGIPTAIHYPNPMHRQVAYSQYCCPDCCPQSDKQASQVLSFPMSADLSEQDQERILDGLAGAMKASATSTSN